MALPPLGALEPRLAVAHKKKARDPKYTACGATSRKGPVERGGIALVLFYAPTSSEKPQLGRRFA